MEWDFWKGGREGSNLKQTAEGLIETLQIELKQFESDDDFTCTKLYKFVN